MNNKGQLNYNSTVNKINYKMIQSNEFFDIYRVNHKNIVGFYACMVFRL